MGMRIFEDAHCSFCDLHTDRFCDRCHKAICDDHTHFRPVNKVGKKELCPECIKKSDHFLW